MEEKVIEAKIKNNKLLFWVFGISIALIVLGTIIGMSHAIPETKNWGSNRVLNSVSCFIHWIAHPFWYDFMLFPKSIYLGTIGFIFSGIILWQMSGCSLTVTNYRVTGKAGFKKVVDLPLSQISAVGLGMFNRITVATSSGKLHFWWVENRNDVHKALSELLSKFQQDKTVIQTNVVNSSNADELAKYKQLLDNGIITQEEFDAKKKQLLNL